MFSLIPREEKFFDCFEKLAALAKTAAAELEQMLIYPASAAEHYAKLNQIEDEADDCVREIKHKLDKTFITPIDREDIAALTKILDDIVDMIESAGQRVVIFAKYSGGNFDQFGLLLFHAQSLSKKLLASAEILPDVISKCLRKPNREETAKVHAAIHALENAADEIWEGEKGVLDTYVAYLAKDLDALVTRGDLLMAEWKELCHDLERITDLIKNTVDTVSSIVDKFD